MKLKISLKKLKAATETLLLFSVNSVVFYAFLLGLLEGEVWVFVLRPDAIFGFSSYELYGTANRFSACNARSC